MRNVFYICFIALFFITGCAFFETHDEERNAEELITDAMYAFEDGKYEDAIESFETLRDWYPFSKYAILAEFKIAACYFNLKQYDEAIFTYEEFERLHPRNEVIPQVIFQIGLCHYNQIRTSDRDQVSAQKAFDTFSRLRKQFPGNIFAKKADEFIKKAERSLAEAQLGIGMFYYKSKHYKGALARFKNVISNYPDTGIHYKALQYITACEIMQQKNKE